MGAALVETLGDPASADRLRREPNNQYRLLRVVDILLQSGGVPLAGGQGAGGRRTTLHERGLLPPRCESAIS